VTFIPLLIFWNNLNIFKRNKTCLHLYGTTYLQCTCVWNWKHTKVPKNNETKTKILNYNWFDILNARTWLCTHLCIDMFCLLLISWNNQVAYSNEIIHIYICMKLHVYMCMKLERHNASKKYWKHTKISKEIEKKNICFSFDILISIRTFWDINKFGIVFLYNLWL